MKLDPAKLIRDAKKATGIDRIYNDSFTEGLEVYCRSVSQCDVLNEFGEATIRGLVELSLANRLRVDDYWYRHPELADQPIVKPMFVMGMLRTGTTLTVDMIARDPVRRCLYGWEVDESIPPPVLADMRRDPRYLRRHRQLHAGDTVMDKDIHWEEADDPTECVFLLAQDFKSAMIEAMAPLPEYSDWLRTADFTSAYEYHRRTLQILQSKSPGQWILKAPNHAAQIHVIRKVYPDARIVVNHRNPLIALPSTINLFESLYIKHCRTVDRTYLRELYTPMTQDLCTRIMAYRDAHGSEGFYDLHYPDLRHDKIAALERLYAHFGERLSDAAKDNIRHFLACQQHGENQRKYSLADYDLAPDSVRAMFSDYIAYYRIDVAL